MLAVRLWPLDEVAGRYDAFIETYRGVPENLERMRHRGERLSEHDFLPGALHIAIRFNECFESDPLLPPELLPRPWPGREARDLLARCRRLGVLAREDKGGPGTVPGLRRGHRPLRLNADGGGAAGGQLAPVRSRARLSEYMDSSARCTSSSASTPGRAMAEPKLMRTGRPGGDKRHTADATRSAIDVELVRRIEVGADDDELVPAEPRHEVTVAHVGRPGRRPPRRADGPPRRVRSGR